MAIRGESLRGESPGILTLRPANAGWHIVPGMISRRCASRSETAILEGTTEAPLAHRRRVALRFVPAARSRFDPRVGHR